MLMVPLRVEVKTLPADSQTRLLDPRPLDVRSVSHSSAATAVQGQPTLALTVMLSCMPPQSALRCDADREYVQAFAAPSWVTVVAARRPFPSTVSVPTRRVVDVFASTA